MRRGVRFAGLATLVMGALALVGAACSLDLDESLIDKAKDAGSVTVDGTSSGAPDGDGSPPNDATPPPPAAGCATDLDCPSTDPCLKGRCDLSRKRCVYDVCRLAACSASACSEPAHACGTPATYKLLAGQFSVPGTVLPRGAAAVYPYLYLATSLGLVAYDVSNPASPTPREVPVVGLGFVPNAMVASGGRVWLVGGANGSGPSRVQLAYIDSPADPFAKKIEAVTVLATSPRAAEALVPFGRSADSVFLVSPTDPFPTAAVEPPIIEPLTLTLTSPAGIDSGAGFTPSASSGKRLLASSTAGQTASFALVDNAGSANATLNGIVTYADAGAVTSQRTFAQSADGVVFWATVVAKDQLGNVPRGVRGYFPVAGETAPIDPAQLGVDVEIYDADGGPAAAPFGPNQAAAAMVDSNTAMVAVEAHETPAKTSVQLVSRSPLGLVKDGATPRRALLPVPVTGLLAAAGSAGAGYLVFDKGGSGVTVYVFDSACAP